MVTATKKRVRWRQVFLSHKNIDKDVAVQLKELLTRHFKSKVFLSSDAKNVRGGLDWQAEIEIGLRSADVLLLLFSDPRENWDWCMYEAGYFLGTRTKKLSSRLIVLHPEGVPPPAPFSRIQTIPAAADHVESWLRDMFVPKAELDWANVAQSIGKQVQGLAVQFFTARNIVHVEAPFANVGAEDLSTINVTFDQGAGSLFERADRTYSWSEIKDTLIQCRFDLDGMRSLLQSVRDDRHLSARALSLFVAPGDHRGYRPIVVSGDLRDAVVRLTFCLVNIPPTFQTEAANAFDTVYQLVLLACRFRREITERHADELEAARNGDPRNELLLRNLRRGIESLITDAFNRRLTPQRVMDAFDEPERNEVQAIREKWRQAHELFDASTSDFARLKQVVTVMRHLNHRFLEISLKRLETLAQRAQLPSAELLEPQLAALLPHRVVRPR